MLMGTNSDFVMSSLDFLSDVINPARVAAGERPHEPRKFLVKVEDEIGEDLTGKKVRLNNNQTSSFYYDLTMEQMLLVGMRESKAVRRSVISKLKELQNSANNPALPQTYIQALEALLESEKEKERLALANKEMAPKADVYDRIVDRNNLYIASQVAQKLGQSAVWLNKQLEQHGVYNRSVKRGRVFQQWFIDKGYGIMRETNNGRSQAMFYAEGEMWIVGKLTDEGLI